MKLAMPAMKLAMSALAIGAASGCGLSPIPLDESCPENRRRDSGECCPEWTRASGSACEARLWRLPGQSGLGQDDAHAVNVAVDGLGRPSATWVEANDSTSRVAVAEMGESGFQVRRASEGLSGQSVTPDIAAGPDGSLLVSWKQQYPGEVGRVFASERDASGTWKDPGSDDGSLSFLPTAYEPRGRFFPNGNRLLVWNQWIGTGYGVVTAARAPASDWELPMGPDDAVSQHIFFSNDPQPAVNARGDALVTWYQSVGGSLLAWESERFGYDGAFSHPGLDDYLSPPSTPVDSHPIANPKAALSSLGDGAVAWTQENGKGSLLVYLATRTPGGAWTKPASVDDALSPRLGVARCVQIAFAPSGDFFAVWYQDIGDGDRVFAAHRSPDGQWVEPGREPTLLSSPGVEAVAPSLAIGPGGGVVVAWAEKQGDNWVIAARRRGQTGTEWGPIDVLSSAIHGGVEPPTVAVGGPEDSAVVGFSQGPGKGRRAYFATLP